MHDRITNQNAQLRTDDMDTMTTSWQVHTPLLSPHRFPSCFHYKKIESSFYHSVPWKGVIMPHPHIPGMSLISNLLLPSAKQVSPGCTFLISDCLRSISWCTTYMYIMRCHTDPTEYRQLGPTIDKASCNMKTLHGYEKLTCFCFFMMVENSV